MELRQLRYFLVVAEELSFTRAAERLHIAQPPLSRQVRQLEDELGVQLIDRSTRQLQLTDAGRFLRDEARYTLKRMDAVARSARHIASQRGGQFEVGLTPAMMGTALLNLLHQFRDHSPELAMGMHDMTSAEQVEALRSTQIDVGLGRTEIVDPEIEAEILAEEQLSIVVPGTHRLAGEARVTLAQVADEPFVLYPIEHRPGLTDYLRMLFRMRGFHLRIEMEASSPYAAIRMVAAGFGVTVVPSPFCGGLYICEARRIPLADAGIYAPVVLLSRKGDRSPALARFRGFIRAGLAEQAPAPREMEAQSAPIPNW